MPSAVSPNPRAGSRAPDDLDNLFNYDNDVEDFLKDLPIDKNQSHSNAAQETAKNIDEEIIVKKKRKPVPKLDEARLLSDAGIPRLRKITKSRLKFRGKGHEFSDISRLLNTYQLWLDDLYPRAKFRDALSMVEKLGHSKRMQTTRKGWLDATKPYQKEASPERLDDVVMSGALPNNDAEEGQRPIADESDDEIFGASARANGAAQGSGINEQTDDLPEEDELDALLAAEGTAQAGGPAPTKRRGIFEEDDDSDPDDLDALLAEQSSTGLNGVSERQPTNQAPDDFADDEEAMASMGDMW